jgi:hypothetical protein
MGGTSGEVRADVYVRGDMQGQIAVGNNIVQIGVVHGNVVVPAPFPPQPVRRPDPIQLRPRPPAPFFGRATETALLVAEARAGRTVVVQGPAGIGRSALLRHVATRPDLRSVVHFSARDMTLDDVVQVLFEACYTSVTAMKPTPTQARLLLREVRAVVVIDEIAATDVVALGDIAPCCGFIVATTDGDAAGFRSIHLSGLSADGARALFQHGLGRALLPSESSPADRLCLHAGNAPNRVLAAAAAARSSGRSLTAFADSVWTSGGAAAPRPTGADRHLLDVLAAVPGVVLDERWLAAIAGVPDPGRRLARWTASGLVEHVSDGGYRAVGWRTINEHARSTVIDQAVRWAQGRQGRAHRPSPTVEALRRIQADCADRGEWHAVLELGSVLDPSYAHSGRWDAWHEVLTRNLTAARATDDRVAESLALHQLGTREQCLLGTAAAANLLAAALVIRKSLGDAHGAAATHHNLAILPSTPGPLPARRPRRPRNHNHVRTVVAASAAVMTAAAATMIATLATASASVSFERDLLTFAAQPVSLPGAVQTIALLNDGRSTAHLTGIRTAGADATDFEITTTNCTNDLAAGQTCLATVAFTPSAEGPRQASLAVDMADGEVTPALLAGTGMPPIGPTLSHPPAFTQILGTTSAPATVTLTPPSGGPAQIGSIALAGPAAHDYTLVDDTCSRTMVPAGGACTFAVRFAPSATGTRDGRVDVGGPDGKVVAAQGLHGTGTAPPGVPRSVRVVAPPVVPTVPVTCTVPNLVELTPDAAEAAIAATCAVVGKTTTTPAVGVQQPRVTSSVPAAGATVPKGQAIHLAVTTCGVGVPKVINAESIPEAVAAIQGAGLKVGSQPSEYPEGDILETKPAAGQVVACGSTVNLLVSPG